MHAGDITRHTLLTRYRAFVLNVVVSRSMTLLTLFAVILPNSVLAEEKQLASKHTKMVFSALQDNISAKVAAEVLAEAYSQLAIQTEFVFVPASRALLLSSTGKTDGEAGRSQKIAEQQQNLIRVDVPIFANSAGVFAMQPTPLSSKEVLRHLDVICIRGIRTVEIISARLGFDCILANNHRQGVNMLRYRRADVLVASQNSVKRVLRNIKQHKVSLVLDKLYTVNIYHYLHKKHVKLVAPISQVLKHMQVTGRIQQITAAIEGV